MRLTAFLLASLLVLTACGDSDGSDDTDDTGSDTSSRSTGKAGAGEEPSAPTVEILESGFGQDRGDEDHAQGVAIVTTDDEAAVGEFVTVSMSFLDDKGDILATSEQVESLAWVGQELVLPLWGDLSDNPGVVASVEAFASVSDYGSSESRDPLPTLEAVRVSKGEYGGAVAAFEYTNETDDNLEDARVGVVCRDAAGTIMGGESNYPSLVAAGQSIRLDVDLMAMSGVPDTCRAYLNYGD